MACSWTTPSTPDGPELREDKQEIREALEALHRISVMGLIMNDARQESRVVDLLVASASSLSHIESARFIALDDTVRTTSARNSTAASTGPVRSDGGYFPVADLGTSFGHLQVVTDRYDDHIHLALASLCRQAGLAIAKIRAVEQERRQAATLLDESTRRFSALMNLLPIGVGLIDKNGVYLDVNEACAALVDARPQDLIGHSISELAAELKVTNPDGSPVDPDGIVARAFHGAEIVVETKQGTCRHLVVQVNDLPLNGGEMGLIGVAIDVTDQRRLEERSRMGAKLEAIGHLAGGVAHDFNNMLAIIRNCAAFALADLQEGKVPEPNDLEQILTASDKAAFVTRQLLSFSRQSITRTELLPVNETVTDTGKLVKRLLPENINLSFDLFHEERFAKLDKGQFEQIIMNLVINSRDALPHGGNIRVVTLPADIPSLDRSVALDPGIPYVVLSIEDDGIGMDTDTRQHVFDPFFTTKAIGQGTGLGLSTAYAIVSQAGGAISVTSEPGEGTRVDIYLPIEQHADPGEQQREVAPPKGSGEKILVVEDDEAVRNITVRQLERNGYVATGCESGALALERLADDPGAFALMVTDCIMPGMDGATLSALAGIPTIFMSGYPADILASHGIDHDSALHLPKPFSEADLVEVVGKALDSLVS